MIQRYNTIRVRFALWTAGLLITALVGFGIFVYLILGSELARSVDDSLQLSAAQAITAAVDNGQISVSDGVPEPSALTSLHDRGFTIRIFGLDGTILKAIGAFSDLTVNSLDAATIQKHHTRFDTVIEPVQQEPVRFYTAPIVVNNRVIAIIQVGQSLDSINDTLEKLLAALLISVPLLVALAAGAGYLLAARALSPIDTITRTAQSISAHDLHQRLNLPATNDEIGRLGATFDTMLGRLDDSFRRERQFTADASHELRTPLTAMQTIIGVVRETRRSPEHYEKALDDLGGETNRLRALVENLLQLARNDIGSNAISKSVDLSILLSDVAEVMTPLAESKALSLTWIVPDNMLIIGSSDDLVRLFMNLVDNAIKYTDRGKITLQAKPKVEWIEVTLSDTGIGIDREHLLHLFDRFYRVDLSRSVQGNGLGLSIAQTIVQAHHGQISVSSELGQGTTFTVQLPIATSQPNLSSPLEKQTL
ncbi:MAG: HAMP domain-containing protein [Anaerolineae bacterium]|nr:HAMP domain-containing protein [Anaerolineae bacterium]